MSSQTCTRCKLTLPLARFRRWRAAKKCISSVCLGCKPNKKFSEMTSWQLEQAARGGRFDLPLHKVKTLTAQRASNKSEKVSKALFSRHERSRMQAWRDFTLTPLREELAWARKITGAEHPALRTLKHTLNDILTRKLAALTLALRGADTGGAEIGGKSGAEICPESLSPIYAGTTMPRLPTPAYAPHRVFTDAERTHLRLLYAEARTSASLHGRRVKSILALHEV